MDPGTGDHAFRIAWDETAAGPVAHASEAGPLASSSPQRPARRGRLRITGLEIRHANGRAVNGTAESLPSDVPVLIEAGCPLVFVGIVGQEGTTNTGGLPNASPGYTPPSRGRCSSSSGLGKRFLQVCTALRCLAPRSPYLPGSIVANCSPRISVAASAGLSESFRCLWSAERSRRKIFFFFFFFFFFFKKKKKMRSRAAWLRRRQASRLAVRGRCSAYVLLIGWLSPASGRSAVD